MCQKKLNVNVVERHERNFLMYRGVMQKENFEFSFKKYICVTSAHMPGCSYEGRDDFFFISVLTCHLHVGSGDQTQGTRLLYQVSLPSVPSCLPTPPFELSRLVVQCMLMPVLEHKVFKERFMDIT